MHAGGFYIPGYKLNYRDSDFQQLGIVTDRYKVVQNVDTFQKTVEKELQTQNMTLDKLGFTWRTAIQILTKRYKVIQEKANGNDSCSYTKITNSNGDRVKAYHIHLEALAELVKEDS